MTRLLLPHLPTLRPISSPALTCLTAPVLPVGLVSWVPRKTPPTTEIGKPSAALIDASQHLVRLRA